MKPGVSNTTLKQNDKGGMEVRKFTASQKKQGKFHPKSNNAYYILRFQGYYPQKIGSKRTNNYRPVLSCFKVFDGQNSSRISDRKQLVFVPRQSPSHTFLVVRRFLAKNNVCVLNPPPYSPDLAPCDYSLFPKLKMRN
ncbi:hypothetical protein TNCV_370271 [Trichonephila clavipes]|nr:hypothetical protein TNCV_370271 [Trichonephila clavipes]